LNAADPRVNNLDTHYPSCTTRMANSPTEPTLSPSSPVPTGWDEYLSELGLSRAEQQELDSGNLSLGAFVDRKVREEARVNAAFYRKAGVEGDNHLDIFVNYMIEAIDQLRCRHEDDRYRHIPYIPGVVEVWLIKWVEERYDKLCARQHKNWEVDRRMKEEMQTRLSTIIEHEEYESED